MPFSEAMTLGRRRNVLWLAWNKRQPMNPPEAQRQGETQVVFWEEEEISAELGKETDFPTVTGVPYSDWG